MSSEGKRLIKNLIGLLAIAGGAFSIYYFFFRNNEEEFKLVDTPIHIESIRTIAELSTVSYKDEVVMDTVEYTNNNHSFYDPRKWYKDYYHNIERRLTIIVRGEVKYGIDLHEGNFTIDNGTDTVHLHLPSPKITDVIVTPSKTEVYEEKGDWNDRVRTLLEDRARIKLKKNAKEMDLAKRAKENTTRMFNRLLQTDKVILISFDHE